MRDVVHDLVWSICEETSWVLPAHEEQGPRYLGDHPAAFRTEPLGAHTMLTREPDSIDLFAAETGAALAETVYLVGRSNSRRKSASASGRKSSGASSSPIWPTGAITGGSRAR